MGLEFFLGPKMAIFVLSSTGDGDPPDNAAKFMRKLHNQSFPERTSLAGLRFALLGSTLHSMVPPGCRKEEGKGVDRAGGLQLQQLPRLPQEAGEAAARPRRHRLL